MRKHGTSLHIDGGRKKSEGEEKEVDFFDSITQEEKDAFNTAALDSQVGTRMGWNYTDKGGNRLKLRVGEVAWAETWWNYKRIGHEP